MLSFIIGPLCSKIISELVQYSFSFPFFFNYFKKNLLIAKVSCTSQNVPTSEYDVYDIKQKTQTIKSSYWWNNEIYLKQPSKLSAAEASSSATMATICAASLCFRTSCMQIRYFYFLCLFLSIRCHLKKHKYYVYGVKSDITFHISGWQLAYMLASIR